MDRAPETHDPANAADLHRLHGKIVLVKSSLDRRNPPSAMRGTIEVRDIGSNAVPEVSLSVEFPQMFKTRAHHRTIPLDYTDVMRLLESEYNGTFEFTIDQELE